MTDDPAETELAELLESMRAAYRRAAELLAELAPRRAFDAATVLTAGLRELADQAARQRGVAVARIRQAESLSLAALAGRLGVSKSRVAQLTRAAAAHTGKGNDG